MSEQKKCNCECESCKRSLQFDSLYAKATPEEKEAMDWLWEAMESARLDLAIADEKHEREITVARKQLRVWVKDIMERRDYAPCWFCDDDGGDCGNWPTCYPHCSLREMMDYVGIVPQEDGSMDKQCKEGGA